MTEIEKPFKRGNVFQNYTILRLIGQGGFSYIYHVKYKDKKYALKVESKSNRKSKLDNEINIIRTIHVSKFFPDFIDSGNTEKYNFYLMELLGPNLTTIRKRLADEVYSFPSFLLLSIHMLRCIQEFHNCGYIHRDIKPANFLVKANREFPLTLIDFGLARQHIMMARHPFEVDNYDYENDTNYNKNTEQSDRQPIPQRAKVGFVGTLRYCSLHAHECIDLGRCDDLISWFYSIVELFKGKLPWSDPSLDRETVRSLKEEYGQLTTQYNNNDEEEQNRHPFEASPNEPIIKLCIGMPKEFSEIYKLLNQYTYESTPDYSLILSYINRVMKKNRIKYDTKLDWEQSLTEEEKERISLIEIVPQWDPHIYKPSKKDIVPIKDDEAHCKCLLI